MSRMYTQEEYDAAILAHKNVAMDGFSVSIEEELADIKKTIDSTFRWTRGLLIGLYPLIFVYILFIFK